MLPELACKGDFIVVLLQKMFQLLRSAQATLASNNVVHSIDCCQSWGMLMLPDSDKVQAVLVETTKALL